MPPRVPAARPGATKVWALALIAGAAAVGAVGVGALLANIAQRQQEQRNPFYRVATLTDTTTDPAIWGQNFPIHYDHYRRTADQERTRYGGSEALLHHPTARDPRTVVAQSRLDEDPRLKAMWAGYAFATDFREERGHAWMLIDQEFTERQQVTRQPGTCIHCHASTYAAYVRVGDGDIVKGFEALNQRPYAETRAEVTHPVSCVDCHDPGTMQLRITRPAFMEGMRAWKASQGVRDYDVNTMASRQEMRSFVCGQCHVEYYFKGAERRLTYPWGAGLTADSMLAEYRRNGHVDWTHARTGARVLKAQHPEFEMYMQGVHARSQVACADCHMPYTRVGAMKVSTHHVRSPMLDVNRSCQTCHRQGEEEILARVAMIQDRTYTTRGVALDGLLDLITDLEAALRIDSTHPAIAVARDRQRSAQFLVDFVEAENSMGFHAPQEAMRLLALGIDHVREGQKALRPLLRR